MKPINRVLNSYKHNRTLTIVVLVQLILTATLASPSLYIREAFSSNQEHKILPYDPIPSVMPSDLNKPQQYPERTVSVGLKRSTAEDKVLPSTFIVKRPIHIDRIISRNLVHTQTVTSFL